MQAVRLLLADYQPEIDTPADDFTDVLMGLVNQGAHVNPAQGEKPQADWPFYGLMIMVSGGEARGRIWLPTATTNAASGGWYTHEMQVIKDDPSGGAANETSPNMLYIVQEVKNSRVWQLNDPQQAKLFVEQCVTKMHDVNALFGHMKEDAGGYSSHSVLYKADATSRTDSDYQRQRGRGVGVDCTVSRSVCEVVLPGVEVQDGNDTHGRGKRNGHSHE
jgi:hypothetical protein